MSDQRPVLEIRVECYAGYRGEQTPRVLVLGSTRVRVVDVLDQWLAPDHRYFKLRGDDGHLYLVRYSASDDTWELTLFEREHRWRPPSIEGS